MKKLIAISVMFALVAGAVFAADVSATVETRWRVINGDFGGDDKQGPITTQGFEAAGYLQASGSNDDGTFGATVRVRAGAGGGDNAIFHKLFTWWKPIDQFRFWLGRDPDGVLNTNELARWSFHATNDFVCLENWAWDMPFAGNWDQFGAWFSFYLVDGLDINLVLDLETRGSPWNPTTNSIDSIVINKESDKYLPGKLQFVGGYALPGIGKAYLVYRGAKLRDTDGGNGLVNVSFLLTAVDGLRTQIGFSTTIPEEGSKHPMYLGLSASYNAGDVGVNLRSQVTLRENRTDIKFQILPIYRMAGASINCIIGAEMGMPEGGDMALTWQLNPYVKVGNFYAGLQIVGNNADGTPVNVRMPVGIAFGF